MHNLHIHSECEKVCLVSLHFDCLLCHISDCDRFSLFLLSVKSAKFSLDVSNANVRKTNISQ